MLKPHYLTRLLGISLISSLSALVTLDDDKLDVSKITNNRQQFIMYTEKGNDVRVISLSTRTIKDSTLNGRAVLFCIQSSASPQTKDADTCVLDHKTLLPLQYKSAVGNKREYFTFANNEMNGIVKEKDSADKVHKVALQPETYVSVAKLEIFQALNLKLNQSFKMQMINPGLPVQETSFLVEKEEKINTGGNSTDCWVILDESPSSKLKARHWVSKTDQKLIRTVIDFPNGLKWYKVRIN